MVFYIRDPDSVLFWTQVLIMTHSGVCLQVSDSEEPLLHFLLSMCSSEAVRRPVCLTCRRHAPSRAPDLRRFSRADRDFITRLTPPLQLTCVHLHS
ncbi:CST complex subunit CTC1 [Oryzias melastigma]|uniref:CST complex subunit CTC1 n=1 Tax=Oryzias melastigma TaxID=30732 RepID=A0A834C2U1_ORYME|nr:CST complex subunit CTC1 [Oryzias melastigma]